MNYLLHLATLFCLYLLLAQAMNLYVGYTGILGLCTVALYAIGAYTSTLLVQAGLPFALAFLCAGLLPAFIGVLLGLTSIRLRADYLGIVTLAFAQIINSVLQNWNSLTNGALGIAAIPKPSLLGYSFDGKLEFFLFVAVLTGALTFGLYKVMHSSFGRVLQSIREDEVAAQSLGKNTVAYKLTAFGIASLVAGFAGSLYAHFITYISPTSFTVDELSLILVITVIGGLGTFRGPFLGVFTILILSEGLRFLDLPAQVEGPLRYLLYSIFFLLTLLFIPTGLGGFWKHGRRRGKTFTTY
jgi:branched-chain amino acid transport system permease protein